MLLNEAEEAVEKKVKPKNRSNPLEGGTGGIEKDSTL
jgi:hypothetical protein